MGGSEGAPRAGRLEWSMAGVAAGVAGLAVSYLVGALMGRGARVVTDVADLVIEVTPGPVAHWLIDLVGTWDKPLLLAGIVVGLFVAFVAAGLLSQRGRWMPATVVVPVVLIALVAALRGPDSALAGVLTLVSGVAVWLLLLAWLTAPLRPAPSPSIADAPDSRTVHRRLLFRLVAVVGGTAAFGGVGRLLDSTRRQVESARELLRLPQVSRARVPAEFRFDDVPGLSPWRTPNERFYRIDTAVSVPSVDPTQWRLRIHGLVERELDIGFDDLLGREFTEDWVTLCCVSNPVGGELIGNARWSGVRVAELLEQAKPLPGADAVLQTSADGWNCGTPLEALTDDRNALLAVAMNGEALPLEHGFPVRMVVPGLYGYVSATKWLVDLEVSRFSDFDAYWTQHGWAEEGPVKMSSRVDVPGDGEEVPVGTVVVAGVAWSQQTGIDGVEVSVDGGVWRSAELAGVPNVDTWVQWRARVEVGAGDHVVKVRATDRTGRAQTGAVSDVLPDGATGWHRREFTAVEA